MGSMSAANETSALKHAERIRKLLESAGYDRFGLTIGVFDAGCSVFVMCKNPDAVLEPLANRTQRHP